MNSSSNTYVTVIYHNGRYFEGPNGVQFEGEAQMMKIKRGITYNDLKRRIYQKLGLQGNQCIHRLIARVETIVGNGIVYYISSNICDDEDVECVLDAFDNRKIQNLIEIYVEVDSGQSSSAPMHRRSPQHFTQEERVVGLSAPAQVFSQITLREFEEEEEDEEDNMDSDDEGEVWCVHREDRSLQGYRMRWTG